MKAPTKTAAQMCVCVRVFVHVCVCVPYTNAKAF